MILVMGGTADGRELVRRLAASGHRLIVSTATEYGAKLLDAHGQEEIHAGRLDRAGLVEFIRRHAVDTLIDATHPYAEIASRTAIDACRAAGCRYLRYERQPGSLDDFPGTLIRAATPRAAAEWARTHSQGPILLTTGSKTLPIFVEALGAERLVARVLPTEDAVRQCRRLGLDTRQIVAMRGPFGHALNKALMTQFSIRLLVSKEGGEAGGLPEKLSAAAECAVPVLLVDRPAVDYPNVHRRMDDILLALEKGKLADHAFLS
jgi:precorrin-6A/cobalt-precorrin-6A reductase